MKLVAAFGLCLAFALGMPVLAQDKPADNMDVLLQKIKADKKLVVADNMGLTETEAKAFWPVYDAYQSDLMKLNARIGKAITSYADAYNAGAIPDAKATELLNESLAIEDAELKLKRDYLPKLGAVLPGAKVARYYQIESKIRAAIKFEMAAGIPLVN